MPLLLTMLLLAAPHDLAHAPGDDVLGAVGKHVVSPGESLVEIARQYNVGYDAIVAANPGVDPYVPPPGAPVVLPTGWIVPRTAAPGTVVVNLSEMRLYVFPRTPEPPVTFPVGVGDGTATPLGTYTVISKQARPTWFPPASIRREEPGLPASVPPGPDNPLGTHALRLSNPSYLIHGTNEPWSIGRRATHGCIRLYPEDIPHVFAMVPAGAPVAIVREPVKVGMRRGRVFVEVHVDAEIRTAPAAIAEKLLAGRGLVGRVDPDKLAAALRERKGIPVDVTVENASVAWTSR